jgi:hypothetical protein
MQIILALACHEKPSISTIFSKAKILIREKRTKKREHAIN